LTLKNKGNREKEAYNGLGDLLRDVPDHDLGILRARGNNVIIEGMEIDIEDDSLVSIEERGLGRELAMEVVLPDPEGASSACLPAACHEEGVGFDEVRVPGVAGGFKVVHAVFLLAACSVDVAEFGRTDEARHPCWFKEERKKEGCFLNFLRLFFEKKKKKLLLLFLYFFLFLVRC